MKITKKSNDKSWKALFGALTLDQSADAFVEELKKDRTFISKATHESNEYKLSSEQNEAINQSKNQIKDGQNLNNDESNKEIDEWLSE